MRAGPRAGTHGLGCLSLCLPLVRRPIAAPSSERRRGRPRRPSGPSLWWTTRPRPTKKGCLWKASVVVRRRTPSPSAPHTKMWLGGGGGGAGGGGGGGGGAGGGRGGGG